MSTTDSNRFLDTRRHHGVRHDVRGGPRHDRAWAVPASAADRVLVVLIENGGVDLGLPDLVDRLISGIPGASSLISDSMRAQVVAGLRDWLTTTTDHLLESAELALNRYTATAPATYGQVVVLRDSTATFAELRNALLTASQAGKVIDVVVLTHGDRDHISAGNGIDGARLRSIARDHGGPLSIRSVYMMNCVGSSLNQAWLDIGARTSAGTHENNYLPEPTTYFFFSAWKAGQTFESAVTGAYRRTIDDLNAALRGLVTGLVPVAGAALADRIDVSSLGFVVASRPEVVGTGSLTISSDALPPAGTTSTGQSLVTTVVPGGARALVRPMSVPRSVSPSGRTFIQRWESPGPVLDQRILAVEKFLGDRVAAPLTQPQVDALASFGVGIGSAALLRSTLMRMLDAGDLASVPAEMRKWTRLRRDGVVVEDERLLERRRAEAELFGGGPVPVVAVPASREVRDYSYQQNPAAAAIGLAEVVEWGLAAGAIVQAGVQDVSGTFSLTYDDAHRLLTPQGRLGMPGVPAATTSYRRRFLTVPQFRAGTAHAAIDAVWSGNAYGEITSVVFERVLTESSEWTRSDLRIAINAMSRIPVSRDPREWPITFRYQGTFDPLGNGYVEFQGEVEVNAFGGLRWISPHQVVSRSLSDVFLSGGPEDWVRRGPDVWPATPTIPAEQAAFLRANVPG